MLAETYHQIMPSGSKENARKSQQMAKTLVVSKGKMYMDISMLAGTAQFLKASVSPLWMNRIQDFFFRDIRTAVPGKTVSAAFKQQDTCFQCHHEKIGTG